MMKTRDEREQLAKKRLLSILERHGAAIARTIEQKISDAGPYDQRIDPHILNPVRNHLVHEGRIIRLRRHGRDWYHLPETPSEIVDQRIETQFSILRLTLDNKCHNRLGEVLEIAVFRALRASTLHSLGGFRGLTDEPTTARLPKEEPPSIFGGREIIGNKRLDFLIGAGELWAGIECKNIREWIYPDRNETRNLISKSIDLNIPPILIARRIPFVTRMLFEQIGMILWKTRSQYFPHEYSNVAASLREKTSLGYFDIRVTDHPDARLLDFVTRIIPEELPDANRRFAQFRDLSQAFASRQMSYKEFSARVRRRTLGLDEDGRDEGFRPPGEPDEPEEVF